MNMVHVYGSAARNLGALHLCRGNVPRLFAALRKWWLAVESCGGGWRDVVGRHEDDGSLVAGRFAQVAGHAGLRLGQASDLDPGHTWIALQTQAIERADIDAVFATGADLVGD